MPTSVLEEDAFSPGAAAFAGFCRSNAVDGRVPKRAFVPERLGPKLLPNICILQWHAPDRLTVRLAGTSICANYGAEITGRELADLSTGEPADETRRHHLGAFGGRGLAAQRVSFDTPIGTVVYERLMQPLADETGAPCCLGLWLKLLAGPERRAMRNLAAEASIRF